MSSSSHFRRTVFDKTAAYAERVGDVLAGPWYRLSAWAAKRWKEGS